MILIRHLMMTSGSVSNEVSIRYACLHLVGRRTENLSLTILSICQDISNTLIFSVVSAWEIQIKKQLGKLTLNLPLIEMIEGQKRTNHVQILPCRLNHVLALEELPLHHRDPFDRLLIAQAKVEEATLLSKDTVFADYDVEIVW